MGRRKTKLSLELIPDEKSRKVTFRKRKKGLFKKAYELSTLCDVKVCTIVYEKKSNGKLGAPETFPKTFGEAKEIIDKYFSNSSKIKKVQNLADFYATQTVQVKKEILKLRNKTYEDKYPAWDDRLNNLSVEEMSDLLNNLEGKIQSAQGIHHMKLIESQKRAVQETQPPMVVYQNSQMLGLVDHQNPSDGPATMTGWTQFASTSWDNNNNIIQYNSTSTSDCNGAWEYGMSNNYIPVHYMDGNPAFYNHTPPSMYDSIFPGATSHKIEAPIVEQPIELPTLSVQYDRPFLLTMQPSYVQCPAPSSSVSSSEYAQQFLPSQSHYDHQPHMFYTDMLHSERDDKQDYIGSDI